MAEFDVDLFVIGGGSGGVRAARIAANYGAKVMVAEEYRMGGTCVIRGCVPKKLLVYGAHFAEDIEDARRFGWDVPVHGVGSLDALAHRAAVQRHRRVVQVRRQALAQGGGERVGVAAHGARGALGARDDLVDALEDRRHRGVRVLVRGQLEGRQTRHGDRGPARGVGRQQAHLGVGTDLGGDGNGISHGPDVTQV